MNDTSHDGPLTWKSASLFAVSTVASFQLAYSFSACSFLILVYLWSLFELTRLPSGRLAFYGGLGIGLLCYAPQLAFFWNIFGPAAIALWLVLAFWMALFLVLARLCRVGLGRTPALILIPFLWTGLEYFRSELYYLRFSWLNAGYVLSGSMSWLPFKQTGVYGMGFFLMLAVCLISMLPLRRRFLALAAILVTLAVMAVTPPLASPSIIRDGGKLAVAGIQLEFPSETEVIMNLNKLIAEQPAAQLLVLSEYTLDGPVPERIKKWCREHQRHLIIGGKDPVSNSEYYNTAFVINPEGNVVFQQAKSVPIQFFKDGRPATAQRLWESPWGKIGICICYDLSYSRVTDQLVRLGAQALVVPTMDVADWGRHQHELHARIAPMRAVEYGIPVFRLASSGISQCVCATGETVATAPFGGESAILSGRLDLLHAGQLPWDRVIAPLAVGVTGLTACALALIAIGKKGPSKKSNPT